MSVDTPRSERVFRSAQQAGIGWILAVLVVALGVVVLLLPTADRHGGYVIAIVAFLIAVGMGRFARCGVYASAGGVRVKNIVRTTDLAWGKIKEFRVTAFGPCQIALTDGTWVSIVGIQQSNLQGKTRRQDTPASRMIADLNGLLQEHAGTP